MSSIRETLHALIDQMDEEQLETLKEQLRIPETSVEAATRGDAWQEQMRRIRERVAAEASGSISSAELLNEIREERLNDIMGGC